MEYIGLRGRSIHSLLALLMAILPAWPGTAQAGESLFGYVYTTGTEEKGELEFEQWITDREGQAHGDYHNFQLRSEVEYGVTDNLSLSGYLNYHYLSAAGNSVSHDTRGIDVPAGHDPARPYEAFRFDSVSAELVYRILSPDLAPVGLALYLEPEIGPRDRAIEFRVILQKNFLDDRLVLAGNVWAELEHEGMGTGEEERATKLEFDLGLSYRVAPRWSVGLEFRNHNEFDGFTISHSRQEYTAFFLGPNVHYDSEPWWVTLTVMPQIHAIGYMPEQRANIVGNRIYGDEHTVVDGIRLKVGFEF